MSMVRLAITCFMLLLISSELASADPASRFSSLLEETEKVRGQSDAEPEPEPEPEPAACGEEGKKQFVELGPINTTSGIKSWPGFPPMIMQRHRLTWTR